MELSWARLSWWYIHRNHPYGRPCTITRCRRRLRRLGTFTRIWAKCWLSIIIKWSWRVFSVRVGLPLSFWFDRSINSDMRWSACTSIIDVICWFVNVKSLCWKNCHLSQTSLNMLMHLFDVYHQWTLSDHLCIRNSTIRRTMARTMQFTRYFSWLSTVLMELWWWVFLILLTDKNKVTVRRGLWISRGRFHISCILFQSRLHEQRKLGMNLNEQQILRIFADICRAVSACHFRRPQPILHRDIKLENIIIDSRQCYVLCDFGSAILLSPTTSKTSSEFQQYSTEQLTTHVIQQLEEDIQRYTTVAYRAPEMVDLYSRVPITLKADIWAMGCLLYKLMYNTMPFGESILAIQNGTFVIPDDLAHVRSRELNLFVRYMLEIDTTKRPDIWQVRERFRSSRVRLGMIWFSLCYAGFLHHL